MARWVGLVPEATSYASAIATVTEFTEALTESLAVTRNFEDVSTIRSWSTRQVNELNSMVSGEVEMAGNYNDIGLILRQFLGSVTPATGGPTYTHVFPNTTGGVPDTGRAGVSCAIEVHRDDATRTSRYLGCKIVSFGISASLDQSPIIKFGVVGKSETTGASTASATYPTYLPMKVQDVSVTVAGNAVDATSFDLECTWPVDEPFKMGSAVFAAEPIDSDQIAVEGSFTCIMSDTTEYALFDGSNEQAIVFAVSDGTYSLTCTMAKTRITAGAFNITGRDRLEETYSFKSYFNSDATENIVFTLLNTDAAIPDTDY